MSDELAPIDPHYIGLMKMAVEKGEEGVAALERLVGLQERAEDRRAAKDFNAALAAFQAECPQIPRNGVAKVLTQSGKSYSFAFPLLSDVEKVVKPVLGKHGLSYNWDTREMEKHTETICKVRHNNGHSETGMHAALHCNIARMNEQQSHDSAVSIAMRRSLLQTLGLASTEDVEAPEEMDVITAKQAADLEAMIDEVNADYRRYLNFLGVDKITDLPQSQYSKAVKALEEKRRQQ